ncbi:MAG: trypsin-like peptidase domain-containing protein [Candidatus Delongbacteria bacterium]|nr:trypsin-like peptidase domain-containing protein [Candidatus Delongbacteria bacterium]MBN2835818.1 trypsin-like peptidase domain-containing protein [Candidatus Delongbacteria bacterium]
MKQIFNFILGIITGIIILGGFYFFKFKNELVTKSDLDNLSKMLYEQKSQDLIIKSNENSITNSVAKVSPCVVGINVVKLKNQTVRERIDNPFDFFALPPLYQYKNTIKRVKSIGSGFIFSSDGHIITNEHVIHNAEEIIVTTTEGKQYIAEIIGADEISDIAVLKIDVFNHNYIKFGNSDELLTGEWVIALGNPYGLFEYNNKPLITLGVVSGKSINFGRSSGNNHFYGEMIQTDASINPGNSGGPLVNLNGEVIGLNTMIYSENGRGSVGIGFVTPINKVKEITDILQTNGYVNRAINYGFLVVDLTKEFADKLGIDKDSGVVILDILNGSSAYDSGLLKGDLIVGIEGYEVKSIYDIETVKKSTKDFKVGDQIKLVVYRNGQYLNFDMKLKSY